MPFPLLRSDVWNGFGIGRCCRKCGPPPAEKRNMSKVAKGAGAGIIVILLSALVEHLFPRSVAKPQPRRPRRPRMSAKELEAAYEEASRDPAYVAHMRELNEAFDGTIADGLEVVAR